MEYGISITDSCIGWDETVNLLEWAYEQTANPPPEPPADSSTHRDTPTPGPYQGLGSFHADVNPPTANHRQLVPVLVYKSA